MAAVSAPTVAADVPCVITPKIRGVLPLLPGDDAREYWSEVPPGEFYTPAHRSGDGEVMIPAVQQGPPMPKEDSDGEH
jgi:hypothetical protein